MTQSIAGIFAGQKSVTHPSSRRTISTDVRKASIVITIWRTEAYFFNCLINDKALKSVEIEKLVDCSSKIENNKIPLFHHLQLAVHHQIRRVDLELICLFVLSTLIKLVHKYAYHESLVLERILNISQGMNSYRFVRQSHHLR